MASLQDILRYSPFKTEAELLLEVDAITSSSMGSTGTRIIIWNLRRFVCSLYGQRFILYVLLGQYLFFRYFF